MSRSQQTDGPLPCISIPLSFALPSWSVSTAITGERAVTRREARVTRDLSDIELLARKYDQDWVKPLPDSKYLHMPEFRPTGDIETDVYHLIRTQYCESVVEIASLLHTYTKRVSKTIRSMVKAGYLTQDEVYACLPMLRHNHVHVRHINPFK